MKTHLGNHSLQDAMNQTICGHMVDEYCVTEDKKKVTCMNCIRIINRTGEKEIM